MTQINQNINNNPYGNQGYMKPQQAPIPQPVRIPNYYYVPENRQSFKEYIEENPALSMSYDMFMKPFIEHPLVLLGTWLGLGAGLDAYSKACGGEYKTSLLNKAANYGDKLQNSKLIQNKPVQAVIKGIGSSGQVGNKIINNSAILRAMKNTPTMPELDMVKSQMFNQKQEVVQEFLKITDLLKLNASGNPKLKDLGLDKTEIEMLKKTFNTKKISQIPETKAVNQVLLNRLGKTPAEIQKLQNLGNASTEAVKNEILKAMGIKKEILKDIKEDTVGKYINEVEKITGRVKGKVRIGGGHYKWLGPLTKPFERSYGCDGIYNKLHSMSDVAHTGTGKFFSKAIQVLHRGLTFGNGKLGALIFIAPILVETAMSVVKADKDQKIGTAAQGFVTNISWVFTFPLALKMMHALGGIKYSGMTKDQVEQYRNIINNFNSRVKTTIIENGVEKPNPNTFKTLKEYNDAKKIAKANLEKLQKVKGQNIFTRGLRKFFGGMTMDLGKLQSYRNSSFIENTMRKIPQGLRNVGAVPGRFLIWGLLSMGLLDTLLSKGVTSIFGKSYDSMKHDERKMDRKAQEKFLREDLNNRLYEAQRIKQTGFIQPQNSIASKDNLNGLSTRGKNMYSETIPYATQTQTQNTNQNVNKEKDVIDNYHYIPSQNNTIKQPIKNDEVDTYTYIPSQNSTIKPDKADNKNIRTYIPSQEGAKITKSFDNSGLQSALDRASRAETKAMQVLSGNFDGM